MQIKKVLYESVLWRGMFYLSVFVLNIFIARHYEASVGGSLYYIINIYSLVTLFISLSIESGITFFASKKEIAFGKLLGFSLVWTVIAGIISFIIFHYFPIRGAILLPGDTLQLFAGLCFITGNLLLTYCTGIFYGNGDFILPNSINAVINILLIAILPYNGHSILSFINNETYFFAYFGSFLLQGILLALMIRIKYAAGTGIALLSLQEFKLLAKYCLTAYAANIVFFFLYRVDYWFVNRYCSTEELGNYIQVSKLGQLFFLLPTILASAVFPLTASGNRDTIIRLLSLLSRSLLLVYSLACLLLVITGHWLFPFVFGASYSTMYGAFLFLVPGILSLSMLYTMTAFYAGKNQMSVNIKGALAALVIVIAGDLLLIPKYGIRAAALVSSIGYISYQVYVMWVFMKEYHAPLSSFFIFKAGDLMLLKKSLKATPQQDESK